jgi:hypothetical protein
MQTASPTHRNTKAICELEERALARGDFIATQAGRM